MRIDVTISRTGVISIFRRILYGSRLCEAGHADCLVERPVIASLNGNGPFTFLISKSSVFSKQRVPGLHPQSGCHRFRKRAGPWEERAAE